jgi:long-chain acyl-CoA synthetase
MMPRSLADYLENFVRLGRDIAYVQPRGYRTVRWSYAQVADAAFKFARELNSRGIVKGDRVLIWGPNSAQWTAAFWGCVLSGVIVVPMDDIATPDFALRVHRQVDAKLIVCSHEHLQDSPAALQLENLSETIRRHSPAPGRVAELASDDTLEIVFTSGTTAEPKGVMITHGNVLANLAPLESEIAKYLKYERLVHPVRFLNLLPLSHVFGQFLGIFLPQTMGGTVVFQDGLKPAEIISTIRRERVSVLVAVPRVLQALKEKIQRDVEAEGGIEDFRQRFSSSAGKHFLHRWWIFRRIHRQFGWKFWAFLSGGAALDRETEEFWGRLGYAAIQGYGLTETTSIVSVNHPFRLGKGSIGKVLAGREVKLAEDGEILVRGGGVASSYWTGNQLQPVAVDAGWYRTGDVGELDASGNLYFKGRKKEVIVTSAGMNIYPEDLEAALRRQPEIKDALVVPLARGGNAEPCAVLILRDGAKPDPAVKHANETLAEYQRMNHWFIWPEQDFPRTSTQKPRRNVIQEAVQSGLSKQTPDSSALAELIARITGDVPHTLSPEANLESDLNLSSLDRVELLSALEDRYQLDLSESRFASANTVADLERILKGELQPRAAFTYPRWAQRWPVTWIRLASNYLLVRPAVLLLANPKLEGRSNLREVRGPVLVISNHLGDVDIGFIIAALPHHLGNKLATATGGEALQALHTPPPTQGLLRRLYARLQWLLGVALLNLFPLPRDAGFRDSFAYAGECVDSGYSILIFPEGRHTEDGKLLPFRAGTGLLTTKLGIPVVPIRIDGLFQLKQAGKKYARPGQVLIKIGRPITFPPDAAPEQIARELQSIVAEL